MKKRMFRAILLVALVVLLASLTLIVGVLHDFFQDQVMEELGQTTAYIAHGVEHGGFAYLTEDLPGEHRVTWMDADGTVLFDNRENPAGMENHAGREEVREALQTGYGTAVRQSDTLAQRTIYYAVRLQDGSVLRLAAAQYSVRVLVLQALQPVALVMILAFCMAMWLAGRLSRQLVAPINAIDLQNPGDQEIYEELSPLIGRLRSQNRQIRQQMEDLRRRREEFNTITGHMNEGLLIIDRKTRVLSQNAAARRLLGAEDAAREGESVLNLSREAGFRRCVEEALAGRSCEALLERADVCCRVFANPAEEDGVLTGAVILILDVTEKEQREMLRREFTANVSHELKTPLTGILGTAEMMKNGLVKSEDVPYFAGNIYRETQRLIGLVNDIIKLSRLDEGGAVGQWENVELEAVAKNVLDQLAQTAARKQVTMTWEGTCGSVRGVPQIVEEIVYNLCDNAIAYNRPGGSVKLVLSSEPEGECLTVIDTGVGIPGEAQNRVFERFYRVDKSHHSGGTGLGLSIVKHGAAYLGARVRLESELGKGSRFAVIFPKHTDT